MENTATTDTATLHQVFVVRTLDARRERVWAAWTEPERFARWFGTPPFSTPASRVAMDARPGGRWSAVQVSSEDGTELPFMGSYIEVVPPERLVMTFDDAENPDDPNGELTALMLRDVGGRTEMTLHQKGHLPAEQYPLLAKGYGLFFEQLAKYLAEG